MSNDRGGDLAKELESLWKLRESTPDPRKQLVMDPRIDAMIDELKRRFPDDYQKILYEMFGRLGQGH